MKQTLKSGELSHDKYYNGGNILSYNRIFNFCVGNRSIGKSFYWKRYCVKKFIETGRKFIYVRRYKNDIEVMNDKFFEDIAFKFPGRTFSVEKGDLFTYNVDGEIAGYGMGLNQYKKLKSVPMIDVDIIFYDEFLPEDNQYLGGKDDWLREPNLALNLYQSVARGDGKVIREEVRFIFVANSITKYNPFFVFYGIDRELKDSTKYLVHEGYVVEIINNTDVSELIDKSQFGSLIRDTEYGKMALGNQWMNDDETFIAKPEGKSKYWCTLSYKGKDYGVYMYEEDSEFYICDSADMTNPYRYATTTRDHRPNFIAIKNNSKAFKIMLMKEAWSHGLIRFQDMRAKQLWLDFMNISGKL